jgi:hypothetical protein
MGEPERAAIRLKKSAVAIEAKLVRAAANRAVFMLLVVVDVFAV